LQPAICDGRHVHARKNSRMWAFGNEKTCDILWNFSE
jgi:hypothetical protein